MSPMRTETLGGARAFVLHRPHPAIRPLLRQLDIIGLQAVEAWPALPAEALGADFVLYDADMGHDAQFPWEPGQAPMPMIALIGSEAPGRLAWALTMGAHAQLMKPLGGQGVFAALLVARSRFEREHADGARIRDLEDRLSARQTVVQAVMLFVLRGRSQAQAYEALRQTAMGWRVSIEEAAQRLVATQAPALSPQQQTRQQEGSADGGKRVGRA